KKPVVMIFAKNAGAEFAKLVTELDRRVGKERAAAKRLRAVAIVTSDEDGLTRKLNDLRTREKITNVALGITNPSGPEGYKLAKEAGVTAILYERREVRANHAFRAGTLDGNAVSAILDDVPKILDPKPERP